MIISALKCQFLPKSIKRIAQWVK